MTAWYIILMLLGMTVFHELAHAGMAKLMGYKLNKVYLGIPFEFTLRGKKRSTVLVKKNVRGVEWGISWFILGGAVDFDEIDRAPFLKMSIISIVGPLSNLLLAFVGIWIFAGYESALFVVTEISGAFLIGIKMLIFGQIGMDQVVGPIGMIQITTNIANSFPAGLLFVWTLLNVGLFVTNLIPIPCLDGGQVFMSGIRSVFGEKAEKPVRYASLTTLYLLSFLMVVLLAKDIAVLFGLLL